MEGSGQLRVRDAVCVSLERLPETIENAEAVLLLEKFFDGVPAGL